MYSVIDFEYMYINHLLYLRKDLMCMFYNFAGVPVYH